MSTSNLNDDFNLRFSYTEFFKWLYRNSLKKLRRNDARFELTSPSYSTSQTILDKEKNEKFSVKIRDKIDLAVIHQIFYSEDYRLRRLTRYQDISDCYKKLIVNGKTPLILDIGANSGMASVYFAREFPEAKIIAIEPDLGNYQLIKFNTAKYSDRVIAIQAGISSQDGKGTITNNNDANWAFRTELSHTGDLTMTSVNTLLNQYIDQSTTPFLVKIDIEGFEQNLFSESTQWVDNFALLIIELHDWMLPKTANSSAFLKCISKLNRDFAFNGENVFSIKNNVPH